MPPGTRPDMPAANPRDHSEIVAELSGLRMVVGGFESLLAEIKSTLGDMRDVLHAGDLRHLTMQADVRALDLRITALEIAAKDRRSDFKSVALPLLGQLFWTLAIFALAVWKSSQP